MDRRKLVAKIVEKSGVKLDADDPAFLLVELNHLAFEEMGSSIADQVSAAAEKFEATTTRNVDGFVSVANEALSKFIHRTNELKAAIDAMAVQTLPAGPAPALAAQTPTPKSNLSNSPNWPVVIGAFMFGVLFGVVCAIAFFK